MNIVDELVKRFKEDPDLLYIWHASIAVAAQDVGVEYEVSQRAAARFLSCLTGGEVDSLKIHQARHAVTQE